MPCQNQPEAAVVIDADTDIAITEAVNVAPGIREPALTSASRTTHNPAAICVNQILWITETDVGIWISQLDSSIQIKSWETL